MANLIKYSIFCFSCCFLLISCTVTSNGAMAAKNVPTKSFVQVINVLSVTKCDDTKKELKNCITGTWARSASAMIVDLSTDKTLALTVGHICHIELPKSVLESKTDVSVMAHDGKMYPARIINFSLNDEKNPDLCLIEIKNLKAPKVKFSQKKPDIGKQYLAIAAPRGIYHPPVVPIIGGIFSGNLSKTNSMYTIRCAPGCSGSSIINEKGQIVGVIFAVSTLFDSVTLATTWESTAEFLRKSRVKLLHPQIPIKSPPGPDR